MTIIYIYDLLIMALPTFFRLPNIMAIIQIIAGPIENVNSNLITFYNVIKYRLIWNGQVIMLEHFLNDQYDPVNRQIYIEDAVSPEPIFIFNQIEQNEDSFAFNNAENEQPLYLYNVQETNQSRFIIHFPFGVTYNEDIVRAQLKRYVLPTMYYQIVSP